MVMLREGTCRTPYCDAPISDGDHVHPHRDDGPTSFTNGAGLCRRCNQTKESPGWRHTVTSTSPHSIVVQTPNGREYRSKAPPLMGDGWVSDQTATESNTTEPEVTESDSEAG